MAQKILISISFIGILLFFIFMTRDSYQRFQVSKYGIIVDAIVVDRSCPGKTSAIYVTYNQRKYHLWVSYLNCINDFPDGSIVKAKYLDGYYLQFAGEYDTIPTIVMESITFMFLVMSVVGVYQTFFPKKAEEEN
jgi:hypothetical protein